VGGKKRLAAGWEESHTAGMPSDLDARLADPGYTPARGDLAELLTVVMGADEVASDRAEKAVAKLGVLALDGVLAALETKDGPARARVVRTAGRLARGVEAEAQAQLRQGLLTRLSDADAVVRRQAIVALGRLGGEEVVAALCERVAHETRVEHHRALAEALGKSHEPGAREGIEALRGLAAGHRDARLDRILAEAELKVRRGEARGTPSAIRADGRAPGPLETWFHTRRGLEEFVVEELGALSLGGRVLASGLVAATWSGTLAELASSRVALRYGFPLAQQSVKAAGGLDEAVVRALTSDAAHTILSAFTEGSIRYRLEWAEAGRRRGGSMRVAEAVLEKRPTFVNDPRDATWEAIVYDRGPVVQVELWPRGLDDTRFAYRQAMLPASSHPTVAAALARAARVKDDDVVWDPFVGSASELIECARLAPGATLLGCDLDEGALDAARTNLAAAGLTATLTRMDARAFRPPQKPTLLISNPPMGRRIADLDSLREVFAKVLARAAEVLPANGRIVWLSPLPRDTEEFARRHGLSVTGRREVDMGGFFAELQRIERPSVAPPVRPPPVREVHPRR
jgi:23S rRNA G2445 N2-methylase RlmL